MWSILISKMKIMSTSRCIRWIFTTSLKQWMKIYRMWLSSIWYRVPSIYWKEFSRSYSRELIVEYSSVCGITFQHCLFSQGLYAWEICWTYCIWELGMRYGTESIEIIGWSRLYVTSISNSIFTSMSFNWVDDSNKLTLGLVVTIGLCYLG